MQQAIKPGIMPHNRAFVMNLRLSSIIGNRNILFVTLLFISFFLPDGKQTPIDLYWAGMTIATIPFWEGKTITKPGISTIFWLLLLLSALTSTITSWSPAFSLTAWIRLVVGFIWFMRYKGVTDSEVSLMRSALSVTSIGIALITASELFFPQFGRLFPGSLLFSPAGHLPTAYIAIPLIPILYVYAFRGKRIATLGFIAAGLTIVMSGSRGAMFLFCLFLISITRRIGIYIGAIMLIGGIAIISIYPLQRTNRLSHYLTKNAITKDPRWAYIDQAAKGFISAPLLGTGPDTFHLVSKQYASSAGLIAVSAHNAWIQWMTEFGLLGAITAVGFIIYAATLLTHASKTRVSFFVSLIGTMLLSVVEQNTYHYPIVILSTVSLGIYVSRERHTRYLSQKLPIVALFVVAIFCVSWILGEIISWNIAPYRKDIMTRFLATTIKPLTTPDALLIHRMFSRDPDVAMQLHEYPRAISADPTNWSWERTYLGTLASSGDIPNLCGELRRFTTISSLDCTSNTFHTILVSGQFSDALASLVPDTGKSKFFYTLGYYFLTNGDEVTALRLWEQARDFSPNWGYYHIELASLRALHELDMKAAIPILTGCLSNPFARAGCQYYLRHLSELPPPGSLKPHIEAIPNIIDIP